VNEYESSAPPNPEINCSGPRGPANGSEEGKAAEALNQPGFQSGAPFEVSRFARRASAGERSGKTF
jgi:hypothetical protein